MKKFGAKGAFFILLLTAVSGALLAQPAGGDFEIRKSTVDNGGGVSVGGEFTLTATIGQPDASTTTSKGGAYSLAGGFWGQGNIEEIIFKDGFENP